MVLGLESITPHHNDPSIKELIRIAYAIRDYLKKYRVTPSDLINTYRKGAVNTFSSLVKDFENVVTKRFGIGVKIQININKLTRFSTLSVPLPRSKGSVFYDEFVNAIVRGYEKSKDSVRTMQELDSNHKAFKDAFGIDNKSNYLATDALTKNILLVHEMLKLKGVTIDTERVYISGLPKDFYCIIYMDFFNMLYKEVELTPEEIVAIFMHELGHVFTFIQFTYRTIKTSIAFDESVKEFISKKNGTPNEMITYVYSSVTGGKKPPSKNTIFIFNDLLEVISNPINPDGDHIAIKQSEILADQFASRFGLGEYIVSGLKKIWDDTGPSKFEPISKYYFDIRKEYENSIWYFLTLTIDEISNKNIFMRLVYYFMSLFVFAKAMLNDFLRVMETKDTNYIGNYETMEKRFDRIKKDYIRQIRIYGDDMDRDTINSMLNQIRDIDNTIKSINKIIALPYGEKFKKFISSLYSGKYREIQQQLYDMEVLAENLTENVLHLHKEKIKDFT